MRQISSSQGDEYTVWNISPKMLLASYAAKALGKHASYTQIFSSQVNNFIAMRLFSHIGKSRSLLDIYETDL